MERIQLQAAIDGPPKPSAHSPAPAAAARPPAACPPSAATLAAADHGSLLLAPTSRTGSVWLHSATQWRLGRRAAAGPPLTAHPSSPRSRRVPRLLPGPPPTQASPSCVCRWAARSAPPRLPQRAVTTTPSGSAPSECGSASVLKRRCSWAIGLQPCTLCTLQLWLQMPAFTLACCTLKLLLPLLCMQGAASGCRILWRRTQAARSVHVA